jgi:mono/diheme cytochrome c family protein
MKKNSILTAAVVLLAIFAIGCGAGGDGSGAAAEKKGSNWAVSVNAEMLTAGQETYRLNCAPCHGAGGKGDGPGAATLNPKPRDHTNREYMDVLTDQKLADVVKMGGIVSGYPNMPSSPHIRGDDMVALVAFVRSLSIGAENVKQVDIKP